MNVELQSARHRHFERVDWKPSGYDWFGSVPSHWAVAPIYARYELCLGKMLDAKRISGEHLVPYLRNVDVQWDRINVDDLPEMDIRADEYARFTLRPGDLIVCEGGEVGRAALWRSERSLCGFQKALHRLRPRSLMRDDPRFLFYVLRHLADRGVFVALGNPNTIPHLTGEKLRVYRLPFPPLAEQQAIAAFLDRETARIDGLIEKKRRLIELLRVKRQAVISRAATKGLDPNAPTKPSGIDWLGDVPQHWTVRAFRYSARITNGQVDPEQPEYCDLPLIAPNHIESGTGRLLDYESAAEQSAESGKYLFEAGNVLYSKIRPALAKVCMAPERGLCSAEMYPITPRTDLRPLYLMYFMLSVEFTTGVVLLSSRVAMPKMNRRDLGSFAVLVPPLDEQDEIIAHLRSQHAKIDSTREVVEIAIDRLHQYRSAIITAAVTGQIDVRNHRREAPCP
jgi:type I restriction enzyme S subunit